MALCVIVYIVIYLFQETGPYKIVVTTNHKIPALKPKKSFEGESLLKRFGTGLTVKPRKYPELPDKEFDSYCKKYGEWETIDYFAFFKKTAVFYFVDLSILRVNAILYSFKSHEFNIKLEIKRGDQVLLKHVITNVTLSSRWVIDDYKLAALDGLFSLKDHLKIKNVKNATFKIRIVDLPTNQTSNELGVKVKSFKTNASDKKSAMICSKCFHLNKSVDYMSLKYWIELNRLIGYEKISICNHSIENDPVFDRLFQEYQGLVSLESLSCIPNLQTTASLYYKSPFFLVDRNEQFQYHINKWDIVNQLVLNECYLENVDKFNFVAVIDIDETVIPKKQRLTNLRDTQYYIANQPSNAVIQLNGKNDNPNDSRSYRFEDIACDERARKLNRTDFDYYIRNLIKEKEVKTSKSMYFENAYYFPDDFMVTLFNSFSRVLSKINASDSLNANVKIELSAIDSTRLDKTPRSIVINIRNKDEFNYIKGLFLVYKQTIQPYLLKNKHLKEQNGLSMNRFFFVAGELNNYGWGKSIHDTAKTFEITMHHSSVIVADDRLVFDKKYTNRVLTESFVMPVDSAHLSHFRRDLNFPYTNIPAYALNLDFNYFKCYFQKIAKTIR
jgi:hypothetical protein